VSKYLSTIGVDFGVTVHQVGDSAVKVNFFDLAGDDGFVEVREEFYRDTEAILLAFSVVSRESYDALPRWISEFEAGYDGSLSNVTIAVCGNKCDAPTRERVVGEGEARLWAETNGFHYFDTSAQSGQNVSEMFELLFAGACSGEEVHTPRLPTYGQRELDVIHRVCSARSARERLGVGQKATAEEVNRAYKKLASLVHPDKNRAPGSEEAFKLLGKARAALLK